MFKVTELVVLEQRFKSLYVWFLKQLFPQPYCSSHTARGMFCVNVIIVKLSLVFRFLKFFLPLAPYTLEWAFKDGK